MPNFIFYSWQILLFRIVCSIFYSDVKLFTRLVNCYKLLKLECIIIKRSEFIETLKNSYEYYYDVSYPETEGHLPLEFYAEFKSRGEAYFLFKTAKLWAMESNEYVYVYSMPHMDEETVLKCLDFSIKDGYSKVKPHSEHRDSGFIVVFVADSFSEAALKLIKRKKEYKSFKFGLHGWVNLKTAGIEPESKKIVTNRLGGSLKKHFKTILLRSEKA